MPGSSGAIRAGQAYYELFTQNNPLVKGLKAAETFVKGSIASIAKSTTSTFASIGQSLTRALTSPLTAVAAIIAPIAASKLFAEMGAELVDISRRTGASAEALARFGYAAKQTGSDLGAIEGALTTIRDKMIDAARGGEQSQLAFQRLGINFLQLSRMRPEDQLRLIAQRLNMIQNPALKAAAATELLGSTDLVPTLAQLEHFEERAKRLGLTLSNEDAGAAKKLSQALTDLHQNLMATAGLIGAKIAPAATDLINKWIEMSAHTRQWIRDNGDVFSSAESLWAFLKLQWAKGTDFLITKWEEITPIMSAKWQEITAAVSQKWAEIQGELAAKWIELQGQWIDLTAAIETYWTTAVSALKAGLTLLTEAIVITGRLFLEPFKQVGDYCINVLQPILKLIGLQIKDTADALAQLGKFAAKEAPNVAKAEWHRRDPGLDMRLQRIQAEREQRHKALDAQRNQPGAAAAPGQQPAQAGANAEQDAARKERQARIDALEEELKAAKKTAADARKPLSDEEHARENPFGPRGDLPGIGSALSNVQGVSSEDVRTSSGFKGVMDSLRQQQNPAFEIAQQQLRTEQEAARDLRQIRVNWDQITVRS